MLKNSVVLLLLLALVSCNGDENYTPKPRGFFRIGLPERKYTQLNIDCPYSFQYNENARWRQKKNCWGDLYYPDLKATLQLTYKAVTPENRQTLLNDGRELAYKHTVMADGIEEKLYTDSVRDVNGLLYLIEGEAASNLQFFMTDSTDHFLRGVLYFYAEPNPDSLQPVNNFMVGEVTHLIETLKWQNSSL